MPPPETEPDPAPASETVTVLPSIAALMDEVVKPAVTETTSELASDNFPL
jgi:hypothetical protein